MKLFILRNVIWAISALIGIRKPAWKWLAHYLGGSGRDVNVPETLLKKELALLVRVAFLLKENRYRDRDYNCRISDTKIQGHFDNNPQSFGTFGFWSKPVLFFLMGGFTFEVEFKGKRVIIKGSDRYDWYPTDPVTGGWHWSSIGLPTFFIKIAAKLFGSKYFNKKDGAPAVSDELWFDCLQAGAAEFTTHFEIELSHNELRKFKRRAQSIENNWRRS